MLTKTTHTFAAVQANVLHDYLSNPKTHEIPFSPLAARTWSALRVLTFRLAINSTVSLNTLRLRGRPDSRSRSVPCTRAVALSYECSATCEQGKSTYPDSLVIAPPGVVPPLLGLPRNG